MSYLCSAVIQFAVIQFQSAMHRCLHSCSLDMTVSCKFMNTEDNSWIILSYVACAFDICLLKYLLTYKIILMLYNAHDSMWHLPVCVCVCQYVCAYFPTWHALHRMYYSHVIRGNGSVYVTVANHWYKDNPSKQSSLTLLRRWPWHPDIQADAVWRARCHN